MYLVSLLLLDSLYRQNYFMVIFLKVRHTFFSIVFIGFFRNNTFCIFIYFILSIFI